METYSGIKADEIRIVDFIGFAWRERWQLLRFLRWTDEMQDLAAKRSSE